MRRLRTSLRARFLVAMIVAQLCLFASSGPINAAIVNLASPAERATAIALSIFTIHILGDVLSPPVIGALSDAASLQEAVRERGIRSKRPGVLTGDDYCRIVPSGVLQLGVARQQLTAECLG